MPGPRERGMMAITAKDRYEICRDKHRPLQTRVLFIGESRPKNGTFFYCGNSFLAQYTCEAFGPEGGPFLEMSAFLEHFRNLGCFLVDLCSEPVNHLPQTERKRARRAGEAVLADTLRKLRPRAVVVVMRAISQSVTRAVVTAQPIRRYDLPFPAQGHQRQYVTQLREIVAVLTHDGVLKNAR
jgi:hypothetical protein